MGFGQTDGVEQEDAFGSGTEGTGITVAEGVDLSLGRGIVVVHQSHTGPGKALLPLGFGRLLTVAAGKEQERAQ